MRESGDEIDLEVLTYSAAFQRITDRVVARLGEVEGPEKRLVAVDVGRSNSSQKGWRYLPKTFVTGVKLSTSYFGSSLFRRSGAHITRKNNGNAPSMLPNTARGTSERHSKNTIKSKGKRRVLL
jgi:hypothetical protein